MKKIPCLFVREFRPDRSFTITPEVTPGCEWVTAGSGLATRKRDGTACAVIGGRLFARYDAKKGRVPPFGAVPCDAAPDPLTGRWPHWVPVLEQPVHRWHREAWAFHAAHGSVSDGTYELLGPAVQGNPERLERHVLARHGAEKLESAPCDFEGLRAYLTDFAGEGIVFHHPDGRMAKIRRDDFGLP